MIRANGNKCPIDSPLDRRRCLLCCRGAVGTVTKGFDTWRWGRRVGCRRRPWLRVDREAQLGPCRGSLWVTHWSLCISFWSSIDTDTIVTRHLIITFCIISIFRTYLRNVYQFSTTQISIAYLIMSSCDCFLQKTLIINGVGMLISCVNRIS